MNVYTDPRLLDVAAALAELPSLPLGEICDHSGGQLAPMLAPNVDHWGHTESIPDKSAASEQAEDSAAALPQPQEKSPLTEELAGLTLEPPVGFEPATCSLRMNRSTN